MTTTQRRLTTRRLFAATAIVAALCVLVAAGCHLIELAAPTSPTFSHATHVKEKKLDCADCHSDYETSDQAGMPFMELCAPCHGAKDDAKPPLQRAAAFLKDSKDGEPLWSQVTRLPDEVRFSHQVHHAKEVACAECHRGIEESTRVTDRLAIGKPECMDCHARRGISNDCAVCHETIRRDIAPASHRLNWLGVHGQHVRSDRRTRSDCNLCHTEDQCSSCHQEMAPRTHTNFWRQRGHGVATSIDRDDCRTCHQVDFCDRCHQDTAPRSHTGSFASSLQTHCLGCHTPLSGEPCLVCHKGTPSHFDADLPLDHNPGMNCRQCHGAGVAFRHVDNGDTCVACHR